ncbi:MAG: bifunctional phosphoribosylaminoimidazolecarboxamide formyltransferase/IMP cyclohydrolase [Armatimonadota bacterium]|nr:bifunctional phosphoribosylaminoimidazolecarboxamide formyltransferase/IMP cyclohydrolase [Armatimonadota bacterium]MDR5697832.1 bifunctional phosphoribosylaminoimidazolecarboxamide formyltransferase/IMP cyclohydrolase [Armatimonadota bacterium]
MSRRALISVTDKTGLVEFAQGLVDVEFEIVSTGGTAAALRHAGLPVRQVCDVTNFPEILEGRVKTLHPAIHAGILARPTDGHLSQLAAHGIETIDLVAVNLYDFEGAARRGVPWEEMVEQIDVGGPAMIRAAAKNCERVTVVTDPSQYPTVLAEIRAHGTTSQQTRYRLAAEAFSRTALYDTAIARALADRLDLGPFPPALVVGWTKVADLWYGENPHQAAAFYRDPHERGGLATADQLSGKPLSYNNILDADAALGAVSEFGEPACVVVKHTNPCGCAVAASLVEAFKGALRGDPVSAFGGVVACNRPVDAATAQAMREVFLEVVVAPAFEAEALEVLRAKKNLRLLAVGELSSSAGLQIRSVGGGVLVQEPDARLLDPAALRVVTSRHPTSSEWEDLHFAWAVCKHTKSNAIVLARGREVVGVGAGQMSRVDSVRLATAKAGERARGAVLASDGFFPFPDGVEEAVRSGVVGIVQPGGSVRDAEVIAAAERAGCAMVLTGVRHFRH